MSTENSSSTKYQLQNDHWSDDDDISIMSNMDNAYYVDDAVRRTLERDDLTKEEKVIIQRLAMKSFHLPGNGYWEDWVMFVANNHIVLSFCFAHPLHPFGKRQRVVNLVASLAFGLIATCCVVLYYFFNDHDLNHVIFSLSLLDRHLIDISSGMLFLAIFGGMCNVLFDFGVWFLQACPPCQPGGLLNNHLSPRINQAWIWLGEHLAVIITIGGIALAVYVIVLRASVVDDGDPSGLSTGIEDYSFVASFFVEVGIAQFVMFPLVAGTIFTGVLGCGRIPGIGGRPYQCYAEQQRQKRKAEKQKRRDIIKPEWGEKPLDDSEVSIEVDSGGKLVEMSNVNGATNQVEDNGKNSVILV